MNLSQHFTLEEFTASSMAARHGLDNAPPAPIIDELKRTAALMEQVRTLLNHPISISSGYRSSAVNKLVGSKPTSKHVQGLACDFTCRQFGTPSQICEALARSDIIYDRVILEFNEWVHIQVGTGRKSFTINKQGTFTGIHP